MKLTKLFALCFIAALVLCGFVYVNEQRQLKLIKNLYRTESLEAAVGQQRVLESTFREMYQGLRVMARLPGIQKIDRYARNFTDDARLTAQEIYNNLASNVAMSEVYIVPLNFRPEEIDPGTGDLEIPIFTFDHLIIGRNADSGAIHQISDPEVPEIEMFEYQAMVKQLAWFQSVSPKIELINDLNYPAHSSSKLVTCDNSHYSPSNPDDEDRSGIVYSVPFFDVDGQLKGMISAVILADAIRSAIKANFYSVRNGDKSFESRGLHSGTQFPQQSQTQEPADTSLIFSEVINLQIEDASPWVLVVNQPASIFWSRPDVGEVRLLTFYSYCIVCVLSLLTFLFAWSRVHQQAMLKAILHTAADSILIVKSNREISASNASACALFGYTAKELRGMPITSIVDAGDQKALLTMLSNLDSGIGLASTQKYIELKAKLKNGKILPIEVAISLVNVGAQRRYTVLVRDLSQRNELEAKLRQSQKLESIGQLTAGIAHEINTPIQFVGDNINFLKDEFLKIQDLMSACEKLTTCPTLQREAAVDSIQSVSANLDSNYLVSEIPKAIQQSIDGIGRVKRIIGAMKEFSHPGTAEKQAIDLNRALESATLVSTNEWKYVAEMKLQFDSTLPLVLCLPSELNQVILNLVVNASQSIADTKRSGSTNPGIISITTLNRGEYVEIRVQDNGTGIPDSIAERIFEPYFTTKSIGKGTGQGLAIARSIIVDKHGGTIHFESKVGVGTTFIIRLPLSIEPPNEVRSPGNEAHRSLQ